MKMIMRSDGHHTPLLPASYEDMIIDDDEQSSSDKHLDAPELYIIHVPSDGMGAAWIKHRLERFASHKIDIYTSSELSTAFSDIDLLKDFLEERCRKGAVCLFYVSKECNEDVDYNEIKDKILYFSVFHSNRCLIPIWDCEEARKFAPHGLASYSGLNVQSPKLVAVINQKLASRESMRIKDK